MQGGNPGWSDFISDSGWNEEQHRRMAERLERLRRSIDELERDLRAYLPAADAAQRAGLDIDTCRKELDRITRRAGLGPLYFGPN